MTARIVFLITVLAIVVLALLLAIHVGRKAQLEVASHGSEVGLVVPGPALEPTTTTAKPVPTTTTTARARTAPIVRTASASRPVVVTAGSVNGYPCGNDLPPCWVLKRESGGDPRIWNGRCYAPVGWRGATAPNCPGARSSASGLWQAVRSTWGGFGGYVNAADAPPEVQIEHARQLWAGGRGCSHWSAC